MSEWIDTTLGAVLNFRRGYDLPKMNMKEGDIPVAGSNGIIGWHNVATNISPCITIGRSGSIGKPNFYDKAWAHNTVLYIDDFKGNSPKFLYYLIQTLPLAEFQAGSAVPTLNRNHIHPLSIKFPKSLNTQNKIAAILSSLDDKIETNRAINARLEELAVAIFKSWFIDFEPFADADFIEDEHGRRPKGWKVGKITDLATVVMGQSPEGESLNTEKGTIFYQGSTEFGSRFPSVKKYTTAPTRFAEPFSVLLSVRAPVGALNVANQKCCIGRGLASIKSDYKSFVLYLLKKYQSVLDRYNGEGTVFGCIKRSDVENIPVIIPTFEILKRFEKIIQPIDNQIYTNFCQNNKLAALRDTLLPRLMSGEIKV